MPTFEIDLLREVRYPTKEHIQEIILERLRADHGLPETCQIVMDGSTSTCLVRYKRDPFRNKGKKRRQFRKRRRKHNG